MPPVNKGSENMKKHPVFFTLLLAAVILTAGVFSAYYNTKSFAFDENTVLFSRDNQGITVLDYKIYYDDMETAYSQVERAMPPHACSTAPYIVLPNNAVTYIMYIINN